MATRVPGGALSSKNALSLEQMKEMLLLQQRRLDEAAAGDPITPVSPYVRSDLKKLELVVRSDYLGLLCELHGRKLAEIQSDTDCRLQVMKYKTFFNEGRSWTIIEIEGVEPNCERALQMLSDAYEEGTKRWPKNEKFQVKVNGLHRANHEQIQRVELFVQQDLISEILGVQGSGLGSRIEVSHKVAIRCKTDASGRVFTVVKAKRDIQRYLTVMIDGEEVQATEARSILEAEVARILAERKQARKKMDNGDLDILIAQCEAVPVGANVSSAVQEMVGDSLWSAVTFPVQECFPRLENARLTLFGSELLPLVEIQDKLGGTLSAKLELRGREGKRGKKSGKSNGPGAQEPLHVHVSARTPDLLLAAVKSLGEFLSAAAIKRSNDFFRKQKKRWYNKEAVLKRKEQEGGQVPPGPAVVTPPNLPAADGTHHEQYTSDGLGLLQDNESEPPYIPLFRMGYLGGDLVCMDFGIPHPCQIAKAVEVMMADLQVQAQGFNIYLKRLHSEEIQALNWNGITHAVRFWGRSVDCQEFRNAVEGTIEELLGEVTHIPLTPSKRKAEWA